MLRLRPRLTSGFRGIYGEQNLRVNASKCHEHDVPLSIDYQVTVVERPRLAASRVAGVVGKEISVH
jgi:hypothetical protein